MNTTFTSTSVLGVELSHEWTTVLSTPVQLFEDVVYAVNHGGLDFTHVLTIIGYWWLIYWVTSPAFVGLRTDIHARIVTALNTSLFLAFIDVNWLVGFVCWFVPRIVTLNNLKDSQEYFAVWIPYFAFMTYFSWVMGLGWIITLGFFGHLLLELSQVRYIRESITTTRTNFLEATSHINCDLSLDKNVLGAVMEIDGWYAKGRAFSVTGIQTTDYGVNIDVILDNEKFTCVFDLREYRYEFCYRLINGKRCD